MDTELTLALKRPAIVFVRELLRRNPSASYQEVCTEAKREGIKIYSIVYGRAKALEGLVPVRPRRRRAAEPRAQAGSRRPGRVNHTLESLAESIQCIERDKTRYLRALRQVQRVVRSTLEP